MALKACVDFIRPKLPQHETRCSDCKRSLHQVKESQDKAAGGDAGRALLLPDDESDE